MRDMLLGHLALANLENTNKQFEKRIKFQYLSLEIGNMLMHGYIFLVGTPCIHKQLLLVPVGGIFVFHSGYLGISLFSTQTELCTGALKPLIFSLWLKQDEGRLREALKFANVCGALTVTERGAIPALPTRQQVLDALTNVVA